MAELTPPFRITLSDAEGNGELVCARTVRSLPGRRLVCAGQWQGRNVYVKLFFNTRKARRDWQREQRGIGHLQAAGISTPQPLYSGFSPQANSHVLVLAAIEPAETLKQVLENTIRREERELILKRMARLFAEHHNAGVIQNDPHLNNFLIAGDRLYTLDGADISKHKTPLPSRLSIKNIAAFLSIIHDRRDGMARIFFDEYAAARTIRLSDDDYETFTTQTLKTSDRNIRKFLKNKIFRECTAFSRRRSFNRLVILNRRYDSPGIQRLIDDPDVFMNGPSATNLKKGNTATLASVPIDGRYIVIKHYRVKGILHGLRKTCFRSRAESSWINAHRLQRYGIRTAAPVALIMNTIGPFRLDSYFIAEHVTGPNAAEYFNSQEIRMADKAVLADKLSTLLSKLAENRLHHGDLKASNFIISGTEPALLDLDSMRQYRSHTASFKRAFNKDLERFRRNWDSGSEIGALLHNVADQIAIEFL